MKFTIRNVLLLIFPFAIAGILLSAFLFESLIPLGVIAVLLIGVVSIALVNDFGDK